MKNFNLLQILPSLDSGGVEQGTIDLANFLGEKNIESFIISSGGKMMNLLNKRKVKHFSMSVHSKNFLIMPLVAKKIDKIIQEKNIDIVHVRSRAPAWLLKFIKKKSFKTVSTFHNVYGSENFFKKEYNKALSRVDHIVAISNYVKSQIIKIYRINSNKITVINRGVDINFFNPKLIHQINLDNFIRKFNIPEDNKIILYPGRLTKWKGQIEFLNVMESYKNNKVICFFVGDDKNKTYTSKLLSAINKKKISKYCKILGNFNKDDLKMMYFCADVIISAPLKPEGFGRTISESLAMKKIVLCYDFGGVSDQLLGLNELYKVAPNDQKQLKEKIDKAFKLSLKYRQRLGAISRKHVIKNFSKEKMLKGYLNLYIKNLL